MNSAEQKEIKILILNARTMLSQNDLNQEERNDLELVVAKLSGRLLSVWFPVDWGRRILMSIIFIVGLCGFFTGSHTLIWSWFSLIFFSPRLVGEVAHASGNIVRKLGRQNH
jgi:hypothetical protein